MKLVPMTREEMQDRGNGISQEIEVLEQMPFHPNVVQYLFHQREEEAFRIFLKQYQYSLDKEITERRENKNPFTVQELLLILQDVSSGLHNLHANNIIHRGKMTHTLLLSCTDNAQTSNLTISLYKLIRRCLIILKRPMLLETSIQQKC